jgi:hypothetical protein
MFGSFFRLAARSPSRQRGFRLLVCSHLGVVAALAWLLCRQAPGRPLAAAGHVALMAGIVEGAVLVGWRLTQLPRSQALEFLLVSPLRPKRLFVAEAAVGLSLLALVTLSGLPVWLLLALDGRLRPLDPAILLALPLAWGAVTGLGLTVWAYEPRGVRRHGERVVLGLVVLYLVVGVLAGENLRRWLDFLPAGASLAVLRGVARLHTHNPFGVMDCWLTEGVAAAWERTVGLELGAAFAVVLLLWRAASRLQGHFHDRHYQPILDVSGTVRESVGERPLAWWAVRRVAEYSGRINLWLAGGFGVLYALYLVAGDAWPPWLGRRVFQICDWYGGAGGLATGLVVLSAVPAAFQYGLWDSSAQDRCRRLELLLLTGLDGRDYWEAAAAAAWRRGRGYLGVAVLLWTAAALAGRLTVAQVMASLAAAVLLWALYFALGFRAFARGLQANGLGMLLTVGLPLAAYALATLGASGPAALLPPGMVYRAGSATGPAWLVGPVLCAAVTLTVARRSLLSCDSELRAWYDRHCGSKVLR